MRLEGLSAKVKEVKVTNKGIILNLEDVKLNGNTLDELSATVQTRIHFDAETEEQAPAAEKPEEGQMEMDFDPDKTPEEVLADEGFEVAGK